MKILLSFYPDFKITQLSSNTARTWLSNEYDLFIDVNSNPGSWTAQRKRGTLRNDLMLRGGKVPKEDVEKADALIKRYNEALVTHIIEVEGREKDGIKKDIEVLKWHKKPRGQLEQDKILEFNIKGSTDLENIPEDPAENPYIIKGLYQQEIEEKAKKNQALPDIKDSYMNPKEAKEIIEGLAKIQIPEEALPEEPNLYELPEAPADLEAAELYRAPSDPEAEVRILPGPIIPPSVLEKINSNAIDIRNQVMAAVEKANLKAAFPALMGETPADPAAVLPVWDEKDQALEEKIQEIREKNQEEANDIKTLFANNVIENMEAVKLQPGEDYSEKIKKKFKDVFEALDTEIRFLKADMPKNLDPDLLIRLSKIYESLEVLQLLQDGQARQNLRAVQEKEPEKQARDTLISDVLNEVYINKNGKGYSWRITARAADMETAVKYALFADEVCKGIQKKGDGDNES